MAYTVTLPSGIEWTPQFAKHIEEEKCIGCGRCFRVCGRDVLQLVGIDDEGERIAVASEDDDEDGEYEKKIMTIANPENCVVVKPVPKSARRSATHMVRPHNKW